MRGVAPVSLPDEGTDGRKNGWASLKDATTSSVGVLVGGRGRRRVAGHGHGVFFFVFEIAENTCQNSEMSSAGGQTIE